LTRTELAFLFVITATIVIAVVGALMTVVPLGFVKSIRRSRRRGATAVYFGCIGLAYLMLEMMMLSRFVHIVGDPVTAGAVTISGFLFFSGFGSLTARRLDVRTPGTLYLLIAIIGVGAVSILAVGAVSKIAAPEATSARIALSLGLLAPLGFLMGFPMPAALKRLSLSAPPLIPWAWGINGFASVLAAPLATAIAMAAGFRGVAVASHGERTPVAPHNSSREPGVLAHRRTPCKATDGVENQPVDIGASQGLWSVNRIQSPPITKTHSRSIIAFYSFYY
jgi:hypothetical protein